MIENLSNPPPLSPKAELLVLDKRKRDEDPWRTRIKIMLHDSAFRSQTGWLDENDNTNDALWISDLLVALKANFMKYVSSHH